MIDIDTVRQFRDYIPTTESGRNYRNMGYWFATGRYFAAIRPDEPWIEPRSDVMDHSSAFAGYCAWRRDVYEAESVTHLPSIPDMWDQYQRTIQE